MAQLSASEQALLDSLLSKQSVPEPEKPANPFRNVYDVIAHLVNNASVGFATPEDRQNALDTVNAANPAEQQETTANAENA